MLVNTKRKKMMKRQSSRRGRHEESVVLFREVNVHVVMDADSLIMSKELQTQDGVLKMLTLRNGRMTSLKVQQGVRGDQTVCQILVVRKGGEQVRKMQEVRGPTTTDEQKQIQEIEIPESEAALTNIRAE